MHSRQERVKLLGLEPENNSSSQVSTPHLKVERQLADVAQFNSNLIMIIN